MPALSSRLPSFTSHATWLFKRGYVAGHAILLEEPSVLPTSPICPSSSGHISISGYKPEGLTRKRGLHILTDLPQPKSCYNLALLQKVQSGMERNLLPLWSTAFRIYNKLRRKGFLIKKSPTVVEKWSTILPWNLSQGSSQGSASLLFTGKTEAITHLANNRSTTYMIRHFIWKESSHHSLMSLPHGQLPGFCRAPARLGFFLL